ncbi:terpene synthase family protein [Micromonospora inyonensis]|uniref:Terpene synthase n=1 Tax=Micromonospora inyonensis TaxID=47866 RepID=A0A1C6RI17_9ACTN|nr:terpene synthase [Micromonospora inyonensis]SCL16690.1 Terpene synthase family, metal binding domain [Micromonospora inyonensis]
MTGGSLGSPRFDCPIPPRLSPHADATQEWLSTWLARFDLPLDRDALDRLDRAGIARYAGRIYPDASPADLRTLAALFTWCFLVDDFCDTPHRSTPEEVDGLRQGVIRLLRTGPRSRHPGFTGPLRRMLVDAWRAPRARMPARSQVRFTDAMAHHLDGTWRESVNKAAGRVPTVTEYVPLRRATSAAYVSYALVEFATGQVLPDAVYHHPLLVRIAETANDLLSWFNDVVSLERDRVGAGGHNLVLATAHEHGVPVETAVALVADGWRAAMDRFVALRAAVPSFGPEVDPAVAVHLDAVANSVRGTIDWTLESPRYPAP